MKIGLISAIVLAILLLGSLVYWRTRPSEGVAPTFTAPPDASSAESPVGLFAGAPGPEGRAGALQDVETTRSAAPVAIAPPALDRDLASPSKVPGDELISLAQTSIDEAQQVGAEVFEKRYEGTGAGERRAAQEAIRVLLYASQEGELGKGQALTDEQIQEFKREIEWLTLHELP